MKNSVVCGIAIALISLALNSTFVYPQAVGSVERSKAAQDFLKRYGVSRILSRTNLCLILILMRGKRWR